MSSANDRGTDGVVGGISGFGVCVGTRVKKNWPIFLKIAEIRWDRPGLILKITIFKFKFGNFKKK
jgi:hypothetical protein